MTERLSQADRDYLHRLLDNLIDEVQDHSPNALRAFPTLAGKGAPGLLNSALNLVRFTLTEPILIEALDKPAKTALQQREQLKHWLFALRPLLSRSWLSGHSTGLEPFEVMDALSALGAGEVQPIFQAQRGKNRRANHWTLARRKLQAVVWKKRLLALGKHEKEANHELTVAFGEQWDTMRKWKSQAERILGSDHVAVHLSMAGGDHDPYLHGTKGLIGKRPPYDAKLGLMQAGSEYRAELQRAAGLNEKKGADE